MRRVGVAVSNSRAPALAGNRGFTLLEVMVALVIFTLLSGASYQFLRSLSLANAIAISSEEQRWRLETVLLILEQDMRYLIPRSSRQRGGGKGSGAEDGGDVVRRHPALTNRGGALLAFSRAGLPATAGAEHYAPGRVVYRLQDEGEDGAQGKTLQRVVYRAVDTAELSNVEPQHLLADLEAVSLRFMGDDGAWRSAWPPSMRADKPADLVRLPLAVEFALTLRDQEAVKRVISLR